MKVNLYIHEGKPTLKISFFDGKTIKRGEGESIGYKIRSGRAQALEWFQCLSTLIEYLNGLNNAQTIDWMA